jgi:hypothetical protein
MDFMVVITWYSLAGGGIPSSSWSQMKMARFSAVLANPDLNTSTSLTKTNSWDENGQVLSCAGQPRPEHLHLPTKQTHGMKMARFSAVLANPDLNTSTSLPNKLME